VVAPTIRDSIPKIVRSIAADADAFICLGDALLAAAFGVEMVLRARDKGQV
jgi:hypothetical protein